MASGRARRCRRRPGVPEAKRTVQREQEGLPTSATLAPYALGRTATSAAGSAPRRAAMRDGRSGVAFSGQARLRGEGKQLMFVRVQFVRESPRPRTRKRHATLIGLGLLAGLAVAVPLAL